MIIMNEISKSYPWRGGKKVVLDRISAVFPPRVNTAIMGENGAGKSTVMRLFSGAELPDSGFIHREGTVSWPLGFSGALHGSLTGRENVAFVARMYDRDFRETLDFVEDFAEIGRSIDEPVKTYSSGMRARLAFGMSMSIAFDYYLIDEVVAVGDPAFRRKSQKMLTDRLQNATVILISHSVSIMKEFCTRGLVLKQGKLIEYPSINSSIAAYLK